MSTPFCPRCGDLPRCACVSAHDTTAAGRAGVPAPAQFDQEWVRPYLSLHEPARGDGPTATTVSWVIPQVVHESELPPGSERFGPPVVMVRSGGHRARRPERRRRPLPIAAALATLIGSAAIAGTYALVRGHDTRDVTAPPPASRLDVVDEDETPDATPDETPERPGPPGSLPSGEQRNAPAAGRGLPATAPSIAPSAPAAPTAGTTAPSSATSNGPLPDDGPGTTPPSGTPVTPVEEPTLRRHDAGAEVVDLQRRLARIGSWDMPQRGRYDRHLQDEVARFQATHGIHGDPPGVYGPTTRRLLESLTP
ncbi:peptidoglycan-binding protein [Streptomyces sp. NPDC060334]|uniref:peptidoglycan-binding domain-containing protein n=1 Tax=Streptomyces sp. NPDC060334 TaxID=3347099 RepID=UPI0036565A14